ncbi:MAG: T9SS type A sorting domain-containing protein, partial [Bacteroidota bacterium]|nr:T9SS type A sorting domain-containing protein [Bacteroidota bacterium]
YEISLSSGTDFSNSLSVPFADANFTSEIYVRLKVDLTAGDYNDEAITHTGGGATEVILSCSGAVLPESTEPCLYEDFSGFTDGAHGAPHSVDVSSALDDYTLVPGWEGYKVFSAGGEVKLGSSSYNGYVITPELDMSAGGSVSFDYAAYGSDNAQVQVFFASDGVNFTQLGSDITPVSEFQTHSIDVPAGTASSRLKIGTDNERIYLDNVEVYCGSSPVPELLVNPVVLSDFNYVESYGPSAEQFFTLSGTDLDGTDVSIAPSENYEISVGSGYESVPIVLSAYDGNAVTVNVRLKAGLVIGNYNAEIIYVSGGGADDVSVSCSGYVDENVGYSIATSLELAIYPNPVNTILYVEPAFADVDYAWQLMDIAGKLLEAGTATGRTTIDVSGFEAGMYFMKVISGENEAMKKLIVK